MTVKLTSGSVPWKKYGVRLLLGIILAIFLAWAVFLGWHTIHLAGLIPKIQSLEQDMSPGTASSLALQATDDLAAIQLGVRPLYPLLRRLTGLPGAGPYLGQVEPVLEFANGLGQSTHLILESLGPVLEKLDSQGAGGLQEALFNAVLSSPEQYALANRWMEKAAAARASINPTLLPERVRPVFQKVDDNFPVIQAAVGFLEVAPLVLGSQGPQAYLILAQNQEELRATGGFISGMGSLVLDKGKVASLDIRDSYQIDDFSKGYPKPPQPLSQFMLAGYWVPRDANWSPDFPTAARNAQELYTLSTGVATQGVIAFDQSVIVSLLSALGPVQIEGLDEAIAAGNVKSYMQSAWGQGTNPGNEATWWEHRKDFMAVLGKSLLESLLQQADPRVVVQLVRQVKELLDRGHILLYLNDPDAQSWLKRSGWDGSLEPGTGDFLLLVDSNIGFNKMDAVVERSLDYQVDLRDPKSPKAHLSIRYRNPVAKEIPCEHRPTYGDSFDQFSYENMHERCYWDYWRIYRPPEAALVQARVPAVPARELLSRQDWPGQVETYPGEAGLQVVAGVMVLPTREEQVLEFDFAQPGSLVPVDDQGRIAYRLRLQKQPGLETLPVRLQILLPAGYSAQSGGPADELQTEWTWEGTINQTKEFQVMLIPDRIIK